MGTLRTTDFDLRASERNLEDGFRSSSSVTRNLSRVPTISTTFGTVNLFYDPLLNQISYDEEPRSETKAFVA